MMVKMYSLMIKIEAALRTDRMGRYTSKYKTNSTATCCWVIAMHDDLAVDMSFGDAMTRAEGTH